MSQENAEAARQLLGALNNADEDAVLGLLAAEPEWQVAEEHPEARTCHSIDEIRQYLESWRADFSDLRFEAEEFLGGAIASSYRGGSTASGWGSGLELDVPLALVLALRDGQILRVEEYLDPKRALRAAGLSR